MLFANLIRIFESAKFNIKRPHDSYNSLKNKMVALCGENVRFVV